MLSEFTATLLKDYKNRAEKAGEKAEYMSGRPFPSLKDE